MFCYSDNGPKSTSSVNVWNMDANKAYLGHVKNFLYLDFIIRTGSFQERAQAQIEMKICDRKMQFWKRHPKYNAEAIVPARERLMQEWKSTPHQITEKPKEPMKAGMANRGRGPRETQRLQTAAYQCDF